MVRVSKLTEEEIVARYRAGIKVTAIAAEAEVTRQAIWGTLKRTGAHEAEHGKISITCAFCGEQFIKYRCKSDAIYCSIPCYNADKDGVGYYGKRGTLAKFELENKTSVRRSRGRARELMNADGKVVHHIDGNPFNNAPENLMLFDDHAAHMRYHHAQRNAKHPKVVKRRPVKMPHPLRCLCEVCKPIKKEDNG